MLGRGTTGTCLQVRCCSVRTPASCCGLLHTSCLDVLQAQAADGQRVAIKVLSLRSSSGWKQVELFEREAKALRSLSHACIPKYIDYFEIDSPQDKQFCLVQVCCLAWQLWLARCCCA